jgi:hypothetical protein
MTSRPNFRRWTPPKHTPAAELDEPQYPLYAPRVSRRPQAFNAREAAAILGLFEHEVRVEIKKKLLTAKTFSFTDCVVIARCELIRYANTQGIRICLRGVS